MIICRALNVKNDFTLFKTTCVLQYCPRHWSRRSSRAASAVKATTLLSVPRKISNKKCSPKRSAIKSFRAEVYLPGAIRSHVWLFQSAHEIGLPDFEITSNLRVLLIMNTSVIYENVVVLQMDCDFFFFKA